MIVEEVEEAGRTVEVVVFGVEEGAGSKVGSGGSVVVVVVVEIEDEGEAGLVMLLPPTSAKSVTSIPG